MDETLKRARELLPAIIITVLSMIQALALELFWSRFRESDYLWLGGVDAVVGWMQFGALLLGIIEIWLLYVSLMLRFSWIPSMGDTTVPFFIGLLEFAMIDLIGPAHLGPWFLVLGLLFALATITTRLILRKTRRDAANSWFFSRIPRTSMTDYLRDVGVVAFLLGLGVALWALDPGHWFSIFSLCCGLAALLQQLLVTHRFWLPSEDAG
jgi:hypothetical protein